MANNEIRYDIIGNDRASEAFSRVGREAGDMGAKMDFAAREAKILDRALDRLNGKNVRIHMKVDRDGRTSMSLLAGGGPAAGGGLLAGLPAFSGLVNPYTIGAGILTSPFTGAFAGGSVLGALGASIAGLGIFGAISTGQAPATVSTLQLTAATDRLRAAQANLLKLEGSRKTSAAQLAAAQASVASAQDNLNKLQKQSAARKAWEAQNKGALQAKAAFNDLVTTAVKDLRLISVPFQGVLISIANAFKNVLPEVMQPLSVAMQTMAPAIQVIGTTLAKSFASPAVAEAINNVAQAFTQFLKAFAPQIPGIVTAIAKGITGLAQAFTDHPGMIAAMSSILAFLLRLPGYAIGALGSLARVANWISTGFPHEVSRGLDAARKAFENFILDAHRWWDDLLRDTRITWNDIYGATIGAAIRIGHDIERIFNGVITWFKGFPAAVMKAASGLGTAMFNYGKAVISDFWKGVTKIWDSVIGWFKSLPGKILHALGIASPPRWAMEAGEHIAQGLFGWTETKKHQILTRASTLGQQVGNAFASASAALSGGSVGNEERFAASLLGGFGWGRNQLGPLISLWQRESGWNPWAVNPSSGAYGIPQALPAAWGHPYNLGDWAQQIRWGLAYIFQSYGSPAAAWGHEMQFGWYDRGGYLPPGLSLAWNTTGRPEPVGAAAAGNVYITVNVPPSVNPREAGRQVAQLILAHTKAGGRLYPSGVTPR